MRRPLHALARLLVPPLASSGAPAAATAATSRDAWPARPSLPLPSPFAASAIPVTALLAVRVTGRLIRRPLLRRLALVALLSLLSPIAGVPVPLPGGATLPLEHFAGLHPGLPERVRGAALELLRPAPVHAQETPDAPEAPAGGGRGSGSVSVASLAGLGDVGRILGDVLGGVRTITDTTHGISDATHSIAEVVTRAASTNWWEVAWRLFRLITVRLLQACVSLLHQIVARLLDSSFNFISQTPPAVSYRSEAVYDLWDRVRLLANAGLALVALGGGLNIVLHRRIGTPYHGAAEFLPRLAVGAALANTSFLWTGLAIEVNNALCRVIGESPLPGWERAAPALAADIETQHVGAVVQLVLIGLYALMALLLLVQMLLRLALVDLLIVVAPLATLLLVLPQTEGWWRRWSTSFTSVVYAQFVQVVALKLGGNLLLDIAASAPDALIAGWVLGTALLLLTFQVPSLLHAHVGDGLGAIRQIAVRATERALFRGGR